MQFVSCLQDLSSIEVKIQRADSPTSPRNNFFLPIGDDRERPRSPELLYPPIANITEVWTVSGFWEANHLLRLCFQTAHKGSNGRYREDSGTWLCTIQRTLLCTTFATALERTACSPEANIFTSAQFSWSLNIFTLEEHFCCSVTLYLGSVLSCWVAIDISRPFSV